ncbi:DNA replication licensing factor Mcm3 [Halotydeus destructor]|nr:DNA replication licensing factor Mcm3 [Halotydeus destructor]
MTEVEVDEVRIRELQKKYLEFLDDDNRNGVYSTLVKDMVKKDEIRLIVNINDLRRENPERASALLNNAFEELLAFERALQELVSSINPEYLRKVDSVYIGLEGSFGSKHCTPRTLTSRMLGQVVCLEGIVTKCSLVRPKVVKSVHYCPSTKKFMERKYTDLTSYESLPSSGVYPTKDDEGNLLETEFGMSVYKDHQTFTIQEMPEKAPPGQLPRSVDIIADNDLVDQCKPGDRVQVVGSFRCLPGKQGYYTSGTFRCILLSNHIRLLSKEVSPLISPEDVKKCKNFSKQKGDIFETLARSLAPSIHGHDYIKKALLCMLLGGVEKVLPNGTRLRGDINVMLIGDPSTAKSQLLRYVLHSAPRAIPTTGRGSSGVGLTAAVTSDPETGERRLEAGAMVLADRGVVCIDEFDKMSDIDRTAIHEVMEQGRVTITKAGINARLNARCSVLAAANPVYGRYDEYKSPMENIGMQDSLLSRFDLLFIILDKHERESDENIADHVVRMHRYRSPNEQDGEPLPIVTSADFLTTKDLDNIEEDDQETPIYEKYNNLLHGNRPKTDKIVSVKFMKKYIHIAKSMKPELTNEATEAISEHYSKLRSIEREQEDLQRTQPITARALETLIRLATAHAKGRLSRKVQLHDAHAAIELVQFAYFKKVIVKPKRVRQASGSAAEEEDDEAMDVGSDDEVIPKPKARKVIQDDDDEYAFDDEMGAKDEPVSQKSTKPSQKTTQIEEITEVDPVRFKEFKKWLNEEFRKTRVERLGFEEVVNSLDGKYTRGEINYALDKMQEDNHIMRAGEDIILI